MNRSQRFPLLLMMTALLVCSIACGSSSSSSGGNRHPADDDASPADDDDNDDESPDDDASPVDDDAAGPVPGIYALAGQDGYGAYAGAVELREENGELNYTRLAQYAGLTFPDPYLKTVYAVNTAWTAKLAGMRVAVDLQVADFVASYNGLTRTDADGQPVAIACDIAPAGEKKYTAACATSPGGSRSYSAAETWTYQSPPGARPLFANDDVAVATQPPAPGLVQGIFDLLFSSYWQLPFFDNYRDRPEFKAGVHFYRQYRTDFNWYRAQNPPAIRVVNKWLDDISMAETMLRSRAYSPTLAQKAASFDEEMPQYFLNPVGFYCSALVGSDPLQQAESGDGLQWSADYLGSQAWRYLVTGESAALANWTHVLDGQILAHDIPQDPTTFARTVRLHQANPTGGWVQGAPPYAAYDWLTGGNNDMLQGLYYSYAVSWIYLPKGSAYDDYRQEIADRAVRLAEDCTVALDDGFNEMKATLLAYMTTGQQQYLDRFNQIWSNAEWRLWLSLGEGMFYVWGISDWSGQDLDTLGTLILQLLIEQTSADATQQIANAWVNGLRLNATTGQVVWPIAAYAFGKPPADLDGVLDWAVWILREIPYPKQSLDIDQEINPAWCASPIPALFWKFDWMQGGRFQGLYGTPIFQRGASENNFKDNPFTISSGASDWFEGGGPDFLHAYWLGRYFHVISPDD